MHMKHVRRALTFRGEVDDEAPGLLADGRDRQGLLV